MNTIKQIIAVTLLNLRNLPKRLGSSAVAIVGVGAVVLVFAAVLSMAAGLEKTMLATGSDDTAVIIRSGSTSELNSGLSNEQTLIVANAPGVLKEGDNAIMSAELYVITDVKKRSSGTDANVPFRGVQRGAFEVRDNVLRHTRRCSWGPLQHASWLCPVGSPLPGHRSRGAAGHLEPW